MTLSLIVSFLETWMEGLHITDTRILTIRMQILRDKIIWQVFIHSGLNLFRQMWNCQTNIRKLLYIIGSMGWHISFPHKAIMKFTHNEYGDANSDYRKSSFSSDATINYISGWTITNYLGAGLIFLVKEVLRLVVMVQVRGEEEGMGGEGWMG